jgi:MSHA pilin protein MshD
MNKAFHSAGLTFIELLIFLVVSSITVTGLLHIMQNTTGISADPLVKQQELAIANAYLDEILSRAYSDPDGVQESPILNAGQRALFDDINDYAVITALMPTDINGQLIDGTNGEIIDLSEYRVTVSINNPVNDLGAGLPTARITITVTHTLPNTPQIVLTGYRMNY